MKTTRSKRSSGQHGLVAVDLKRLLRDLANLQDGNVKNFRDDPEWKLYRQYKDADLLKLREELRLLWRKRAPAGWKEMPADGVRGRDLTPLEKQLVQSGRSIEEHICQRWLARGVGDDGLLVDWGARRLRPNPRSLPVGLVWGCLQNADHLAYCENPTCAAPYFIAKRNDQKFCSDACAAPAKRAAKLRWWNENRRGSGRAEDPGKL